jgi:hypothetical protein
MKAKLIIALFLASFVFASCRKQQCPAYGKACQPVERKGIPA